MGVCYPKRSYSSVSNFPYDLLIRKSRSNLLNTPLHECHRRCQFLCFQAHRYQGTQPLNCPNTPEQIYIQVNNGFPSLTMMPVFQIQDQMDGGNPDNVHKKTLIRSEIIKISDPFLFLLQLLDVH